ncbi:phosphatase PAP2 family protein [Micromonospora sp. M42]|uniref:phosphatase PAP2 family protein n=1 Tax=Micromonospora sp. M42 TaxID=457406 RepID=UPI000A939301|nr:phosphatase PAP2 family protein [Micromonospora sp. M42]
MDITRAAPPRLAAWRRAARELALVAVLFLAYKAAGRWWPTTPRWRSPTASGSGGWSGCCACPPRRGQGPLLSHEILMRLANSYYAFVHFPGHRALPGLALAAPPRPTTCGCGGALAALTAVALVLHVCVPLAPPRLTELTGLVDTGTRFGPSVYGPPDTDQLSNQYAAMPSLHVGWALAIALALMAVTTGRLRWLWLLHPLATALVVVVTGNHYWLDGLVSVALLVAILAVLPRPAPDRPALVEAAGPVRPHVVPAPRRAGHHRNPRVPAAADARLRPPGRG